MTTMPASVGGLHGGCDRLRRRRGSTQMRVDLIELHPLLDRLDLGGRVELGVDGDHLVAVAAAAVSLDAVPQALERRDLQAGGRNPMRSGSASGTPPVAGGRGRLGARQASFGGVRGLRRIGGIGRCRARPSRHRSPSTAEREYGNGP